MKEPKRLLSQGATDFERQLLRAVANERPSAVLRSRMQRGLGLVGPLAWASSVKAMAGNFASAVASKLTGGAVTGGAGTATWALTTLIAAGGIAAVCLTPGSNVVVSSVSPGVTEAAQAERRVESPVSLVADPESAAMNQPAALVAEPEAPGVPGSGKADGSQASDALAGGAVSGDVVSGAQAAGQAVAAGDPRAEPGHAGVAEPAPAVQPQGEQDDDGRLREEIALLDTARSSLQRGDRESARASLRAYRERFPDGILRREAGLLRRRAEPKRAR
jgi:hypothetical protein